MGTNFAMISRMNENRRRLSSYHKGHQLGARRQFSKVRDELATLEGMMRDDFLTGVNDGVAKRRPFLVIRDKAPINPDVDDLVFRG